MLEQVVNGPWFTGDSPFKADLQPAYHRLCVITGPNASGKSLLRKVLHARYHQQKVEFIPISQEKRCVARGLERIMVYGDEAEESTGRNSVRMLLKAFQTGRERRHTFALMFDEPEIGCSEETQAAIGDRIGAELNSMTYAHAIYVVTHSRALVKTLRRSVEPTHLRLGGDKMTLHEWADRPLGVNLGSDLEDLVKLGRERWLAVQGILDQRKEQQ